MDSTKNNHSLFLPELPQERKSAETITNGATEKEGKNPPQ